MAEYKYVGMGHPEFTDPATWHPNGVLNPPVRGDWYMNAITLDLFKYDDDELSDEEVAELEILWNAEPATKEDVSVK
jgi:hypothetical protein